jgi:sugar phosphate isomerase/epimerase
MSTPVALQLYSVREQMNADLDGALSRLRRIGLRHVETAGTGGLEAGQFNRRLDRADLSVMSAHMALPTRATLDQTVQELRVLGCRYNVTSTSAERFRTLDGIKEQAAQFEEAAGMLAPHAIRLGLHNHWWEMGIVENRLGIEHFLEMAPSVLLQLDIYWAANFGRVDVPGFIRAWAGRIPMLHVKDGPLMEGKPHTAVGKGRMNIPACVQAADPRVLEWLVIELDSCETDMLQAVEDSFRYLVDTGLGTA